jgi:hypothetical protein
LHKEARYGPVHLAFGRNSLNGEFWVVVSDEPTTLQTFADYGLRFDIEETFLDDQSNGWNVQKSGIRSVSALSRLWLIFTTWQSSIRGILLNKILLGRVNASISGHSCHH